MEKQQLFDVASNLRVYDLEQPRYFGAPILPAHAPGFVYTLHRRHEPGLGEARTSASGFIYTAEHSGTHIDALCHQAEALSLYGGQKVTPQVQTSTGFTETAQKAPSFKAGMNGPTLWWRDGLGLRMDCSHRFS
jgi:hypothetical protein